jgi:hypothetical protein
MTYPSNFRTHTRDVAALCENSLTVSTVWFPTSRAKCMQNEVVLGAALANAATVEHLIDQGLTA